MEAAVVQSSAPRVLARGSDEFANGFGPVHFQGCQKLLRGESQAINLNIAKVGSRNAGPLTLLDSTRMNSM